MNKKIKVIVGVMSLFMLSSVAYASSVSSSNINNTELVSTLTKVDSDANLQNVDKDYIYDKMLNTIDNFKSVKGSFEYTNYHKNNSYLVEYSVRLNGNAKSYEKVTFSDGVTNETLYDGNLITFMYNKDMTKQTAKTKKLKDTEMKDKAKDIKSRDRVKENEKGEKMYMYRQDETFTGFARKSIFSQEMAFGYLSDFNNWDIEGIEKYNDRNCAVVSGELTNKVYSNKLDVKSFKMWVDVNTGILLKYEGISGKNEITDKLETKNFKLNDNINDKDFEKDLAKYREQQ